MAPNRGAARGRPSVATTDVGSTLDQDVAARGPLTAADRCDRCGAQAYVRVLLVSGGELLFCAHHGREHEDRLRELAADFQDETDRLGATPASAAPEER